MSVERKSGVETKIAVDGLQVWYGDVHALRGASLAVAAGRTVALIGAAGCGKTTLLRAINRLLDLDPLARVEGSIKIDGAEVLGSRIDVSLLRRRVGMVFNRPTMLPGSVFDNVVFGLQVAGVRDRRSLEQAAESALRRTALWETVARNLGQPAELLPLEWQQRLCMARMLAVDPDVMLFDDPTSVLDPVATLAIEDVIARLRRDATVLFTTNNLQQAARLSDSTCYLSRGEIVEEGDTMVIFNRPTDTRTEDFLAGRAS